MLLTGFIWIDSGNNVNPTIPGSGRKFEILPTTLFRPKVALETEGHGSRSKESVFQSAQLLHIRYGESTDPVLSRIDAFYAFYEVFQFCAFSELQSLNHKEWQVNQIWIEATRPGQISVQVTPEALEEIRSLQVDHAWQLKLTLEVIRKRGSPHWPRATEQADVERVDTAARQLEDDFDYLLSRARKINDSIDHLIRHRRDQDLTKSRTGHDMIITVPQLTILMMIFTTTFFGMNFKELQTLSIWIYFVVVSPLIIGAATFFLFVGWWTWTKIKKRQTRAEEKIRASRRQDPEPDVHGEMEAPPGYPASWAPRVRRALHI